MCTHGHVHTGRTHIRYARIWARTHIQACAHLGTHGSSKSVRNVFTMAFWAPPPSHQVRLSCPLSALSRSTDHGLAGRLSVPPDSKGLPSLNQCCPTSCWREMRGLGCPPSASSLASSAVRPGHEALACRHHTPPLCPPGMVLQAEPHLTSPVRGTERGGVSTRLHSLKSVCRKRFLPGRAPSSPDLGSGRHLRLIY